MHFLTSSPKFGGSVSIADLGIEKPDVWDREDLFSLQNAPFSGWLMTRLATSSLYPDRYQLRPIENKSSINRDFLLKPFEEAYVEQRYQRLLIDMPFPLSKSYCQEYLGI
jgi:hypothetical protein